MLRPGLISFVIKISIVSIWSVTMKKMPLKLILASLAIVLSVPAQADVKAGVDAWSRGDYTVAVAQWRPLAISGDADAQFNLGQAYKLGRGVPTDLKAAEDWYRKAAQQGHLQAEDNYGLILFQNGDRQKAMPMIERSSARGEPRSQYVLGTALFNGDMVKKDWVRAYALMTRASASGLAPASASLAQMDRYIPLDQRQQGLAMAQQLEQVASRPQMPVEPTPRPNVRPPSPPIRSEPLPPSRPDEPVFEEPAPLPRPRPPVIVTPRPTPRPPVAVPQPRPQPAPIAGPGYRVQLGAFGDASKARALYESLERRIDGLTGLQPYLVKAGPITRLQVGPLANKAAADRLCASARGAGQGCLVIAP
jgi:uncharacterized protein